MEDNKDIEKVSRTVFDNLKMDAPNNAWEKLDDDLDKKKALFFYKQRANRFKLLSIALLFIIFSFITWQYLAPISSTKILTNDSTEKNIVNSRTTSTKIATESNLTPKLPDGIFIDSENVNKLPDDSKENQNTPKLKKPQNAQLVFEIKPTINQKAINSIRNEKQNNTTNFINFQADNNETITESNSISTTTISTDSAKSSTIEQNISATNISDNTIPSITDTSKLETPDFVRNDSLIKKEPGSKSRLSVALFYSPNQSWCNLKDNTNDNFDDVTMYNNRENTNFSFTTGLNLKYELSNKWSLITGATYSTIAKSITIKTMYAKANADNEMHFEYPTSSGVIEIPSDDTHPILHEGDSMNINTDGKQSIKFINVPLMVRFQLTKKKITWYANGGFSANFIVQEKAKINMNNSEMTIINHSNSLKKMNYGFLFGAGVQYNMYEDFGIFIEPVFRGSLTSITRNYVVNSYPYSLGINVGFSLQF